MTTVTSTPPTQTSRLRRILQSLVRPHPSITDIGLSRRAQLLASFSLTFSILTALGTIASFFSRAAQGMSQMGTISQAGLVVIFLIAYFLSRSKYPTAGGLFTVVSLALGTIQIALTSTSEIGSVFFITIPLMLILGIALFNGRTMLLVLLIVSIATGSLYFIEPDLDMRLFLQSFGIAVSVTILALIVVLFRDAVEKERLQEVRMVNDQLEMSRQSLEQRVADRTRDLERRTNQLEAITQIARDISLVQDLDQLLQDAVVMIHDRFGYYHIGLFLNDDVGEYTLLKAATGEAGRLLLANRHKLKIGEVGIVGYVTSTGQARIALDVGQDAYHFRNPLLPYTRSEMALPLRSGERVIGSLDIQSTEEAAFNADDTRVIQVLADQLAGAIESARLLERLSTTLKELNSLYQQQTRTAWTDAFKTQATAFEYDRLNVTPIEHPLPAEIVEALRAGHAVPMGAGQAPFVDTDKREQSTLLIPLMLRGEVIGVIGLEQDNPQFYWTEDQIAIAESVATQTALTLENARLLIDSLQRAERERAISEISTKMGGAFRVENILRTTAEELSQLLQGTEVLIQLQTGDQDNKAKE